MVGYVEHYVEQTDDCDGFVPIQYDTVVAEVEEVDNSSDVPSFLLLDYTNIRRHLCRAMR